MNAIEIVLVAVVLGGVVLGFPAASRWAERERRKRVRNYSGERGDVDQQTTRTAVQAVPRAHWIPDASQRRTFRRRVRALRARTARAGYRPTAIRKAHTHAPGWPRTRRTGAGPT